MASTIQQVVDKAQVFVQDMSDAAGLIMAQELEDELLEEMRMLADTEDITLVADDPDYALDEDILKVWEAEYWASADDRRILQQTSKDYLDRYEKKWREMDSSEPRKVYMDHTSTAGMLVGFVPAPDTATSGTYPFVRLYVARKRTLSLSSTLPQAVQNDAFYVKGIIWKWKQYRRKNALELQMAEKVFMEAKTTLMKRHTNRLSRVRPTIDPYISQTGRPR